MMKSQRPIIRWTRENLPNKKSPIKTTWDFIKTIPYKELIYLGQLFGASWLAVFFISIKSFPRIDFSSLTGLIAITALIGVVITFSTVSYMIMQAFYLLRYGMGYISQKKRLNQPYAKHLFFQA